MTIVLDTPEQINAWVMLSRVSQCSLHLKGLKVNGLAAWLKKNVPAEYRRGDERTVKSLTIPLLDWCDDLGIQTQKLTALMPDLNYQVVCSKTAGSSTYYDQGIYNSMDDAKVDWLHPYLEGRVHIFRTWDAVRGAKPLMYSF